MHLTKLKNRKWTTTDRSTLETIHQSVDEFIQSFTEHLQHIILHDFIEKVQTSYYQDLRDNLLGEKEILVGDFAENFTFVMQDEVQSYHWNNAQATIHPFVCYWLENGVSKHVACVAVSASHMTPLQSICFNIICSLRRCSERSQRKCSISQMVVQVNTRTVRTS